MFRAGILAGALVLLLPVVAVAHDPDTGSPNWITEGEYRGPDNVHCCGPNDCEKLKPQDVTVVKGGYYIRSYQETVPFSEATPSEDGQFWRCHKSASNSDRRCFFAPVGQY